MATFDGAEAAISAAVELQARVRDRNQRQQPEIGLRIGISTGDVSSAPDGDHLGTPVVEAARLCGAAHAGQILIAEVVRLLAGSRGAHELVDLGPREYKGLPDAVTTWEVRWDATDTPRAPLPAAMSFDDDFGFVGRSRERERLDAAWSRSLTGQLDHGADRRRARRGQDAPHRRVRRRRPSPRAPPCSSAAARTASGCPTSPSSRASATCCPPRRAPRLGPHAAELVRLVPEIADRVPDLPAPLRSDPETERYQLFNAYVGLLEDVAGDAPVVLVLDDLHWATRPTLQLLRHVVRSKAASPVLVIGTYRDTEVDDDHPLAEALADLHRSDAVERVDLIGLEVECDPQLPRWHRRLRARRSRRRARRPGPRRDRRQPLLHARGAAAPRRVRPPVPRRTGSGRPTRASSTPCPAGARDVIGQRLARLGEETRSLLARAAVIGVDFTLGLLAQFVDAGRAGDLRQPRASDDAARLVEEIGIDRYRFTHALVRSALLDSLSASRRARLHRQIAEAIEAGAASTDDVVEELADHWIAAGAVGDQGKAIEFTVRAARRAARPARPRRGGRAARHRARHGPLDAASTRATKPSCSPSSAEPSSERATRHRGRRCSTPVAWPSASERRTCWWPRCS